MKARAAMNLPALKSHTVIDAGGGTAWVFGGYNFSNGLHIQGAYKINLASGTVLQADTVPYGFGHSPVFHLDGYAVIPGGMGSKAGVFRSLREIQWLNLSTGAEDWQTEVWPYGGYDISGIEVTEDRAIYFGGHSYIPSSGKAWSRWSAGVIEMSGGMLTNTPIDGVVPRVYATAHRLDDHSAIFIGGWSYADLDINRRNLDTIEIIHDVACATVLTAKLKHARRYHSSRKIGDKIYVMGGTTYPEKGRPPATNSIEEIDLGNGTIREMSPLTHARYHAQTASVRLGEKEYLLLVGGQSDDGIPVTDVELYDVAAETSVILQTTRPAVDHDRISVVQGDTIYVVGGADGTVGNAFSDILNIQIAGAVMSRD